MSVITCTSKLRFDWAKVYQSSHISLSLASQGFAIHVLPPVWLACIFPYLQEWLTFGLTGKVAWCALVVIGLLCCYGGVALGAYLAGVV
jgi:hypothetical protein